CRELVGLLLGRGTDEEVAKPTYDAVALALEPVGELRRHVVGVELDAHLPGRDPFLEQLLLRRGLARLVVPALLVVEPVLDLADGCLDALRGDLALDDRAGLLRLGRRGGVDEELALVLRDHETPSLELL